MDTEIKRLLKLSNIPGFKLSSKEQKTLDEWKKTQKSIKPKKAKKTKAPKGYTVMDGMGAGNTPTIVKTDSLGEVPESVTNDVKVEDKETGELEEV